MAVLIGVSARGAWQDTALEDTNNPGLMEQGEEGKGNKRSGHGTRHLLENQRRYAKAGALFCTALLITFHTALVGLCLDYCEVLGLFRKWRHIQKSDE